MIEHPDEQMVIRRIRELRGTGMGTKAIAKTLDQAGILCRGHRWYHSQIQQILKRAG
jgi:hypothetical protein